MAVRGIILLRVGQGYDVHRLEEGRPLVLGGIVVPYPFGLSGHSDADVLCHAICDALLGAACLGDIGLFFPPGDPKYKNISSLLLLQDVNKKITDLGWSIVNIDATIIAENPKLSPFKLDMAKNIAEALSISETVVNIKATTEEGLGFTGTGQGIAAHAVCLLRGDDDENL